MDFKNLNKSDGHIIHNFDLDEKEISNHDNLSNTDNSINVNNKDKINNDIADGINIMNNDNIDDNINKNSNRNNINSFNRNFQSKSHNNEQKPVDVRIIGDGPEKSEFLSKTIKNIDLFDDFNIIISSIITTNNVEIAKNNVIGSDIVLIATSSGDEGKILFSNFYNSLKTNLNYVEFLNFPKLRDVEITDIKNVENEIKNSIIRAGLSSIFDIANINQVRSELLKLNDNFDQSKDENEKITLENEILIKEAKQLQEKNNDLNNEIKELHEHIDEVKLNFADFKSRYSNIHSRNIIEIFPIAELWIEVFDEVLADDEVDKIVIATNKFKPDNILVGQGYIGAISKEDAINWIKIIKTALIFVENENEELQEEILNYYKKKHDNTVHNELEDSYNNDSANNHDADYTNYSNDNKNHCKNNHDGQDSDQRYYNDSNDNKYNKYENNESNKSDDDYEEDYDITNQFRNFWD
ncbi:hypothetical protein ALNOE001_13480 [Candidatus Methanobinarius endosymbioticus]|uniref:Uncharacterized protein n=1 Tax=Candidatus Methanobinarius endosymbioticus TaxID=2006182 RepID=A0A366M9V4_9EURY|nr:hypothetical protein ALNOE001_13480 [Candidatus Methanobinarius endosymbioticus]